MATIFKYVLYAISEGIESYLYTYDLFKYVVERDPSKRIFIATDFTNGVDSPTKIAYFHYKKWLQTHEDLQIGANYLTNLQLFFVASAVTDYTKHISTSPKERDELEKLHDEYIHVIYKVENHDAFYDAFKCNVTEKDMKEVEIYRQKHKEWSEKIWTSVN